MLPPSPPASFGPRAAAFMIDAVASGLVARLLDPIDLTGPITARESALPLVVLALVYLVGLLLGGQTPGMRVLGLRVVRADGGGALGLVPVALRTALLLLLVPAVISDRSGRGLHDRAAGSVVVRTGRRDTLPEEP